jgi:hypothetical protein
MAIIQVTVSCTVSLVQLTVQCCIKTVCCGFQSVLQFETLRFLLQYVCHSVDCQLYGQFGSADSRVLYTDCVVAFSLCYRLQYLACCYSISVIQLTVRYIVSLVQLTVQCCIQTVCCGFQFVLQFVRFSFLLQYVCHSVDCQLYCQFGSADSTVLYTYCVLWLSVCVTVCNI